MLFQWPVKRFLEFVALSRFQYIVDIPPVCAETDGRYRSHLLYSGGRSLLVCTVHVYTTF